MNPKVGNPNPAMDAMDVLIILFVFFFMTAWVIRTFVLFRISNALYSVSEQLRRSNSRVNDYFENLPQYEEYVGYKVEEPDDKPDKRNHYL